MREPTKMLSVRLPERLHAALTVEAQARGLTVSAVVVARLLASPVSLTANDPEPDFLDTLEP